MHSVDAETRRAWARKGGAAARQRKAADALAATAAALAGAGAATAVFKTSASTRRFLERTAALVEAGKLAPSQAKALTGLAALAVKLAELQIEQDLLRAEMDAGH